ncbi:MAG: nqrF 2 [Ilumatobacteraceae bacterium]|nr:nqrF 2 [Ilumatobacteraceae bacterium]
MPTVVFTPSGRRGEVAAGSTVLDAARTLGVDLDSVCGGRAICGRCQVVPTFGEFSKHGVTSTPEHLTPVGPTEEAYHGRRAIEPGGRLGCTAKILGDVLVDVPAASQMHRPVIRKTVDLTGLIIDPIVHPYYVEVVANDLGGDRSDLRLLTDALTEQWGLPTLTITPNALRRLQPALNHEGRDVTVAVHGGADGQRVITGVWPGFFDELYGVAIDVGSTTVAGHLCDIASGEILASAGLMNPQIRFGEDLMSRVSYVMMNPGGEVELTAAIRGALNDLIHELCELASKDRLGQGNASPIRQSEISDIVLVGNPIMHHLILGIDPTPLGGAPFPLATDLPFDSAATDIGLACPLATLHMLPCIAGHVGADTAGAVLAVGPHRGDEMVLLIDVGTNAELVLGNRHGLAAASSPTGPAFEGAQISGGQRATAGAIERVRIDRDTFEPVLKIIGSDVWSNEPGFAESLPEVGITGICGSGIIEVVAELFLAGIIDTDGTIKGEYAERTDRIVGDGRTFSYVLQRASERSGSAPELRIAQNDVRAIQLAKGALYAGARLLMDRAGLESVDTVKLAGAFGSHIDPVYALVLGMIPDCEPSKVVSVGNAAGSGAVRALLSLADRREIADVARTITKVETAIEPRFQEHFVQAMGIPHTTDPYARLGAVVALPARSESTGPTRTRRRARA